MSDVKNPLLSVRDLSVAFRQEGKETLAVDRVSFDIAKGETLALVGESGSGKSVSALSVLKLLPYPAASHPSGEILFEGKNLLAADERELRSVRGNKITMIFQEPMTSLNPLHTIDRQIGEVLKVHQGMGDAKARARTLELLHEVGIPDPERRLGAFPHQLSGGQRQRVMIAMALANDPKLLIADEPTTALDVTTQAQILRLIERLREELGMAMIIVTHDLGVVAEVSDRVMVMYAGEAVESGTLDQIFYDPQHPYAWGLLGSLTRIDRPRTARLAQIAGQPPSLIRPPKGCHFRDRCPHAFEKCTEHPDLEARGGEAGHTDRCWIDPERKRELRVVSTGEIGLEAPEEVTS